MAERLDLPAPVVTITDPARPAAPVDVIGAEPRQLSPRRKHELWALAGVALLVAAGVWAAQHVQEGRRLDRAALSEAAVQVASVDAEPGTVPLMSLGRHPVTVLSIGLDVPNLPMIRTSMTLVQGAPESLRVPVTSTCPSDATGSPSNLLVRVRTYRGGERILRLPLSLSDPVGEAIAYRMLAPCGGYAPDDSLVVGAARIAQLPDQMLVAVPVRNRASVPRQLAYDGDLGGLGDFNSQIGLLTLGPTTTDAMQLQLYVEDCSTATAVWQPLATDGVRGTVTGGEGAGVLLLPYSDPTMDAWVKQQCLTAPEGQP